MEKEKKYVIGLDFGTLSCRCLIVSAEDGKEIAEYEEEYAHGVMEKELPGEIRLPENYCLQHPGDYLEAMERSIQGALTEAGIGPGEIAGIGLDFTSCTILPVTEHRTPLCFVPEFETEPHAYAKLWKHHGAVEEAVEITELAVKRQEKWLGVCGGHMSAEYGLPKILETLRKAPKVYEKTARFTEAGDWIASMLTGNEVHSVTFAGFKLQWNEEEGYFSKEFLRELDPKLAGIAGGKLSNRILPVSARAGVLSESGAELTGLPEGIPVAIPVIDAHAGMPGCRAVEEGEMMMVLGTSACHLVSEKEKKEVPGIFGCVKDGVIPGYYTYEAGQSAVGDLLAWFTEANVPETYRKEAAEKGWDIHRLLTEKAARLAPGESGLVALDWVGGNRTPYNDAALTGVMTGLKLSTTPEEQYRAWIEALAFGTRRIIDNYEENGVMVRRILVSGGIAGKNPLLMQIYADVTGKKLEAVASTQAAALGSAIYGAVAAGIWPDVKTAAYRMGSPVAAVYEPEPAAQETYEKLYQRYLGLSRIFSGGSESTGQGFGSGKTENNTEEEKEGNGKKL